MGLRFSKPKVLASIKKPYSVVEAGKKTLVCTVRVSVPKNIEICPRSPDVPVPRPSCNVKGDLASSDEDLGWLGLNVQESSEERTTRSKVFRISLYAMKTGRRVLEISFPNDFDVLIEEGSPEIALFVQPSSPYNLQLSELKGERGELNPKLCAGAVAFIYVVASDQYGNLYDGDTLDLSLFNQDSIHLISTAPVMYESGTYELIVRCLKVGDVVCEIGFTGMARPLQVPLRVFDENLLRRVWRRSLSDSYASC